MIEETVKKIEAAIKETHTSGPKNKAKLIALLEKLKREVEAEKRSHVLAAADEELRAAAIEFDTTFPKLGTIIGEISLLLAKIGI